MRIPKNESIGLALVGAGLLSALLLIPDLLNRGGPAPLRAWLGWGALPVTLALVLGGLAVTFAPRMGWQVRWPVALWAELLLLAALVLSHLGLLTLGGQPALASTSAPSWDGRGGGLVGWALSQWLLTLPGPAAWLLAVAWFLAAAWFLWRSLPHAWAGGDRVLRDLRERLRLAPWASHAGGGQGGVTGWDHWTGRLGGSAASVFDGVKELLRDLQPEFRGQDARRAGGSRRSGTEPERVRDGKPPWALHLPKPRHNRVVGRRSRLRRRLKQTSPGGSGAEPEPPPHRVKAQPL